jgi:holo-[acyl-carrier protein] synthase
MANFPFMIVSVGVDMVEVARIRRALEDGNIGMRFRARVYTEREIEYCEKKRRGKYESYAGRFAAKEAVMKALGRGWGPKVSWRNIEVARARGGRPEVVLHNETSAFAKRIGIQRLSLSITHTEHYALAYVIAHGEGQ